MESKKILILYTSVGLGHKMIAENIGYQLEQNGFNVRTADILKVQEGKLVSLGTSLHHFINTRVPTVWRFLYRYGHIPFSSFRVPLASRNYQETKKLIDEFQPDLVIATQTTASAIVSYLKKSKLYNGLFAIAFSDYHLHTFWLYPNADFYLTNIDEQKLEMIERGIPASRIAVCGMTLHSKLTVEIKQLRQEFGIQEGERLVLIGSGSLGTNIDESWLHSVISELSHMKNVHLGIVTGKNESLKQSLEQQFPSNRIHIFGFYKPMANLYQLADLYITKPGGLTLAESWQYRLPVLITHYLPGQEELNVNYLQGKNLVLSGMEQGKPLNAQKIRAIIEHEIATGEFKKSLAANPASVQLVNDDPQNSPVVKAIKARFI